MDIKMQFASNGRQKWTWRISARILLVLFLSLQVLPFISSQTPDEASLPACCRAHGKRHCARHMNQLADSGSTPALAQVTEKCPYTPLAPATMHGHIFKPILAALIFAEIVSYPVSRPQMVARLRISFDRSRQKRGPPASPLS